jgi:hypothetical protein
VSAMVQVKGLKLGVGRGMPAAVHEMASMSAPELLHATKCVGCCSRNFVFKSGFRDKTWED